MTWVDWLTSGLLACGCAFYFAGTVGMLRFPDALCRLHALTKADNLGLMLVCLGLAVHSGSVRVATLLAVVWFMGVVASTVSAHLIARYAHRGMESG